MKYLHNRLDRIEAALDRHQPDNDSGLWSVYIDGLPVGELQHETEDDLHFEREPGRISRAAGCGDLSDASIIGDGFPSRR